MTMPTLFSTLLPKKIGKLFSQNNFFMQRFANYLRLMRFHRPIGIGLLLWPTLWALWIAGHGHPHPSIVVIFIAGVILMRAAGCIINDYADKDFDGKVSRTSDRPLATGVIKPREALILFGTLVVIAFGLVLMLNRMTQMLSVVALLLAMIYPFTKRYTHWPQMVLGLAFNWSIPMAFAAEKNALPAVLWLLLAGAMLWTLAYDTLYAMVDREEDKLIGIKSTAILFGQYDAFIIGIVQLAMLVIVGQVASLAYPFYIGLFMAAVCFLYQQYLIRDRSEKHYFQAFLNNNWVGLMIFLGLVFSSWT